ncbi:hypothetical protein BT63DRAFT_87000 [Microthyrium microscopicum]|uniref:Uncharacterized protein n=1 Tax=Microthyrium microscopicum TaxID=703497 RepID=A0A6A6TZC0_9PEZI|nr:hypothetical protein BT63DRAFT_87000 [Microthyrium microscopicum]
MEHSTVSQAVLIRLIYFHLSSNIFRAAAKNPPSRNKRLARPDIRHIHLQYTLEHTRSVNAATRSLLQTSIGTERRASDTNVIFYYQGAGISMGGFGVVVLLSGLFP